MPQACWWNIFTWLYLGPRSLCLPSYRASEDTSVVGSWGSGFAPPCLGHPQATLGPLLYLVFLCLGPIKEATLHTQTLSTQNWH